jgi:hypothetical protein
METTYRIQVNIKGGSPKQWRTTAAEYNDKKSAKGDCERLQSSWEGLLQFRVIKIEVVE